MIKALQKLQKMFGPHPVEAPESRLLDVWANSRGHQLKRVRRGEGRVVEFGCDDRRGRMEWGPSQRSYIHGHELRIRIDAGLPGQMEMMLMSRRLAQQLGSQAYETLTRQHQTGIDAELPEEVRWLSMLEKVEVPSSAAGYVLMSSSPVHARRWLDADLLSRISRAGNLWLGDTAPLVLMTLRGRVYLRTEAGALEESMLDGARSLAEAAMRSARSALQRPVDEPDPEPAPVRSDITASTEGQRAAATGLACSFENPSVLELPMDSDMLAMSLEDFQPRPGTPKR
ncbi:MAG: hypothetical protein QG612_832 [Pseudomonadota bacterium]|nr:hypothetical protein [Pseudomonadota bacterium]